MMTRIAWSRCLAHCQLRERFSDSVADGLFDLAPMCTGVAAGSDLVRSVEKASRLTLDEPALPSRRTLLWFVTDRLLPAKMRSEILSRHPWFSDADRSRGDRPRSSPPPVPRCQQSV